MSASKTTSFECLKVKETMFEFLKRKKHNQLQNSLKQFTNQAKKKDQRSRSSSAFKREPQSKAKFSSVYDDILIEQHATIPIVSLKKNKFNHTANITPRKITFSNEEIEQKPLSYKKPLLKMISPIKNINPTTNKNNELNSKYESETQRYHQQSNPRKSILKSNLLRKKNSELFSRKNINDSINSIKQTFERIFQAGQIAKQKNNQLSIALVNFVKDLQKNRTKQNFSIDKKLGEVKYILNAIDSALAIFKDSRQAKQIIEQFNTSFSQHLNELEACSNHNMKTHYEEEIIRITSEKQHKIDSLIDQQNKMEKEIQKLNKLLQKNQRQYEVQLHHQNQRIQNLINTVENLKTENQQSQEIYLQKLERTTVQLEDYRENCKKLQKQLKDYLYKDQKSLSQTEIIMKQQYLAREAFLLKQIDVLRHTFNSDISQLHKLYQTKQIQYEQKIQKLTIQLQDQKYERKCDREVSDRILTEANNSRKDKIQLQNKNQELVNDLYRINEDLFQHWMALKDVKTLSERLHIFQHFQRIYLDLAYNPILFRT